jgi:hypothetical protein
MNLRATIRALIAYFTGAPDDETPVIPEGLPDDLTALLREQADHLIAYQDENYAALYLDRVRRFVGRAGVDTGMLREIATLLADRMAYEDLLWFAQLKFEQVEMSRRNRDRSADHKELYRFRADEVVSLLPVAAAEQVLPVLEWLNWSRAPIPLRLGSGGLAGYLFLKLLASLPRWRGLSARYAKESAWCERWLHMIDRSLTRQPEAAASVVHTAALIHGHGESYSLAVANWHRIIDGLAKPAFDRTLIISPLGPALARAQAVAESDPSGARVIAAIAEIRAACPAPPIAVAG